MVAFEEEELGWREMRAGQLEAAEDHFRRALALDPMRSDSLIGLGVVYLAWGELEDAEELFHMARIRAAEDLPAHVHPQSGNDPLVAPYLRALYHLAVTAVRQGLWDDVEVFLQQVLAWDEEGLEGEAFPLLGEACHRRGRWAAAAHYYERGLDKHWWAWYSLGAVYLTIGNRAAAEAVLTQALRQAPEVGCWIMYFPKVVPLASGTLLDESFRDAVGYLVDHIDLWPKALRNDLKTISQRLLEAF